MAKEFAIQETIGQGKALVLRVSGRLDAKNAQEFYRHCREALETKQKWIVANLSDVSFVASSGIGTLLAVTEEFREQGGCVHFVALSEAVRSVVELLNLTEFLTIGNSEDEALQTIGA